jgi:hypothetical protein
MKFRYLTPLLAAAGAAAFIAGAPIAAAASTSDPGAGQPSCTYVNNSADTQCQSPGNVQINDSPPATEYAPYYPYWEGGYYGGFGGGFHGGGGHR